MSIRNRITQFVSTVLSTRIRCTQGGILLGRKTTGAGYAEEITIGTGLELTSGKVLNATTLMGADDNYVTDAEKIKLSNLSGTNSGDETATSILTALGSLDSNQITSLRTILSAASVSLNPLP